LVSLFSKDQSKVLQWFVANRSKYTATLLFETVQTLLIQILNQKLGVTDYSCQMIYGFTDELVELANSVNMVFLQNSMQLLWDNQRTFFLVGNKEPFLEFLLLQLCSFEERIVSHPGSSSCSEDNIEKPKSSEIVAKKSVIDNLQPQILPNKLVDSGVVITSEKKVANVTATGINDLWQSFLNSPSILKQKMLHSTLSSAKNLEIIPQAEELLISLPSVNKFVMTLLEEAKVVVLQNLPLFFKNIKKIKVRENLKKQATASSPNGITNFNSNGNNIVNNKQNKEEIDFSDVNVWPKVNLMLKYFPGSVATQVKKR